MFITRWRPSSCRVLCRLITRFGCVCGPPGYLKLTLRVEDDIPGAVHPPTSSTSTPLKGGPVMAIELPPGKRLRVIITPVDDNQHPAPVQAGSVIWSVNNTVALSITPDTVD